MKYAILSETEQGDLTRYKVILQADDGYEETHEFIGDVTTLEEATKHFNEAWLAAKAEKKVKEDKEKEPEELEFVTVSKN